MKSSALYITKNFIKFTQATTDKKIASEEYQLDIASLGKEKLPDHLREFLKKNNINTDNLTLYIPRKQVAVRHLSLPSTDDSEIKKMVEHKLINLFPYKPEELVFDEEVIQTKPDGYSQLILVAAQRR